MKIRELLIIAGLFLLSAGISAAQDEEESSAPAAKDTPYFSGMPNYGIFESDDKQFDAYTFFNGKDCTVMEGKKMFRYYTLKEGAESASEIQILRNYVNAIKQMGGSISFEGTCPEDPRCNSNAGYPMVVGRVLKGGGELWVEVLAFDDGLGYYLTLVEKESMKQDVTASGMLEAINRDGYVTLYINFDTNRSVIKEESHPIIQQIVQMMRLDESLELNIEGHTDNVGEEKDNQLLSEARAKEVVGAIASLGIDQRRMTAIGYGESRPIADNATEQGRAKNRRVELVKRKVNPFKESNAPQQSMHFGVPVYPGAKFDPEQTEFARFSLGQDVFVYRTNDSVKKVSAFFEKVNKLGSIGGDDKTAVFTGTDDGFIIRIAISGPWEDGRTGEIHNDTYIQYFKGE